MAESYDMYRTRIDIRQSYYRYTLISPIIDFLFEDL